MSSSQLTNSIIFQRARLHHQPYIYIYYIILYYIHHGTYGFRHLMVGNRCMFRCRWKLGFQDLETSDAVGPTVAWISPKKCQVWVLLSAPWDDDDVDVDVGKMMLERWLRKDNVVDDVVVDHHDADLNEHIKLPNSESVEFQSLGPGTSDKKMQTVLEPCWNLSLLGCKAGLLYIYIYIHTHINTCMHAYIRTCMHTCMHTYIHTCMHTYIHTYIITCIHICIHICIHTYIHTHIHTYIHNYIHTYIHAYIHTYIHT